MPKNKAVRNRVLSDFDVMTDITAWKESELLSLRDKLQ